MKTLRWIIALTIFASVAVLAFNYRYRLVTFGLIQLSAFLALPLFDGLFAGLAAFVKADAG